MTGFEKRLFSLLWATGNGSGGGGADDGVYGVEWDYSQPSPALTRTGDAAGFSDPVPATSLTGTGSSPFDNIMPWAGMRMCNIINGQVEYWQGDPQFSETAYDTMVYIPEFWYKAEKDETATRWRWSISPVEKSGYEKHPGSGRYVGRFHSSGSSAELFSKSNTNSLVNTSRINFRSYSHKKGEKWWMLDIATRFAFLLLYLVEFANFNSQLTLGTGQDSGSAKKTGATTGASYHTIKRSGNSNQYRWIENPYSNRYSWVDGAVSSNRHIYIGTDNASFTDSPSSLTETGVTLPTSGYIVDFGFSLDFPWAFIPCATEGGSESTYVTDRVASNTGENAVAVGGNQGAGDHYGLFHWTSSYPASGTYGSMSSRLIFIP